MCILRNIKFLVSSRLLSKLLVRALVNKFFDLCKSWICPGVEYQSWSIWNSTHADQNSEFFDAWAERYGILVTLVLPSNSPDSKAISEFSGMIASTLSLSWIPILEGTRFYIPCLKMMIFRWWKNASRMFWSFYPQMNTISARYIYLHLLLGWFLIEAYPYPWWVKWNPVVLS
jgi:hypothetical protein